MTRVGRVDPRRVVRVTRDGQSYSAIVVDAPGVEKTDCSHNLDVAGLGIDEGPNHRGAHASGSRAG
jgi:hypothetical protein